MKFEEEVLKLLGELNQWKNTFEKEVSHQFEHIDERFESVDKRFDRMDKQFQDVDKRFDKLGEDLTAVKGKTDMTHQQVIFLREDMTIVKENEEKMKEEQVYQLNKWVELDRRINKLERKVLS